MKKPMLTVEQLIAHMKEKGIQFNIISEENARLHLDRHNNYFKLTSYRKDYTKYTSGVNAGKYDHLEFAYLIELARLDTEIRHLLLDMSLDIEHFLKVMLIKAVEDRMSVDGDEDGYKVVTDYLLDVGKLSISNRASTISQRAGSLSRKLGSNRKNPYCNGLINRYADEMPIWAFVELISFGELKDLAEHYSTKNGWKVPVDLQSLDRVRQIRNACAHGNCIINDLSPGTRQSGTSVAPLYITNFVKRANIGKDSMIKKLENPRINQLVHLLYVYDQVVTSQHTRSIRMQKLKELLNRRMIQHREYFTNNTLLVSTYQFFSKLINAMN